MISKRISTSVITCILLLTLTGCGGGSNQNNADLTSQPQDSNTNASKTTTDNITTDNTSIDNNITDNNITDNTNSENTNTSNTNTDNTNTSNTNTDNTNAPNPTASNPNIYIAPGVGCSLNANQQAILSSVNKARSTARNCGSQRFSAAAPLQWNCLLADSAARHSLDMATQNIFNHIGSDGSALENRVTEAGYTFQYIGENIAAGYSSPENTMASWLSSPGHCQNIMNPQFTELGAQLEYNVGAQYRYYWTLNFGRPR